MAPKKRPRKKMALAKDQSSKQVVPPKKRRTFYDPSSYQDLGSPSSEATNKELPEWFKLSVQLLLINFYPEGVAILNNLEADYDAMFKGANIDATEYNFPDWESMLKSPQFKKHCLVYVDKRISYCKGFPMPRSAAITMRDGGVWEICPPSSQNKNEGTKNLIRPSWNSNASQNKVEHEDESLSTWLENGRFHDKDDNSSDASYSCSAPRSPSLEREDDVVGHNSDREMPKLPLVIPSEDKIIVDTSHHDHVGSGESHSITPPPEIRSEPPSPVLLHSHSEGPLTKDGESEMSVVDHVQNNSDIPLVHGVENQGIDVEVNRSSPTKVRVISPRPLEPTVFFRRFDVPPSWTKVLEDHDHEDNREGGDTSSKVPSVPDNGETKETHPSNTSADANRDCLTPMATQETDQGSADADMEVETILSTEDMLSGNMILLDSAGSSPIPPSPSSTSTPPPSPSPPPPSPSPPPPTLSPQILLFEKNASERVKERRQIMMMRDPRKLYISNSSLSLSEESGSNFTNSSIDHIRKQRGSTVSLESGEENSTDYSASENLVFPETEFMPWKCTVVDIPGLDLPYLQALEKAVDEGRVQNVHRDPRLNIGRRAAHFTFLRADKVGETGELRRQGVVDCNTNKAAPVNGNNDKRGGDERENVTGGVPEGERRVRLATPEQEQSTSQRNQSILEQNSECEPNLSITIRNTTPRRSNASTNGGERRIEMFVPLKRVHQFESHLFIEDSIPEETVPIKYLRCSDLWNNVVWKDRFKEDPTSPNIFFNSDIFERWRNLKKRELSLAPKRGELIRELQKYEDKVFPSRCDYYLRTALRMVELDYRTDHQFTEPTTNHGKKLVENDEILFYIDFTGPPGGVVEFYSKGRKLNCKGFGVTYQKRCYNLNSIPDIYPDFFEPFYGKLNGYSGDGNLFTQETIDTFVNRVMEATDGRGVHIVSTLGNITRVVFEDGNDENWKFQHLAQTLMALLLLREGGNFALKMYDLKQTFTVGLVFLLYQCFESLSICKLNIFAPTSSERVIVCLRKKNSKDIDGIVQFLKKCHQHLTDWYEANKRNNYGKTIGELIPLGTLKKQKKFMAYIRSSNERIKRTQIEEMHVCLKNLRKNGSIFTRGSYRALVARTTELWGVPSRSSYCSFKDKLVESRNPLTSFRELRVPDNVCDSLEANLNEFNLYSVFSSTEHWRFSPVGNKIKTRGFYLGVEGIPYFFNLKAKEWVPVSGNEFRLPSRSLLYGEIVQIFTKDGTSSDDVFAIIDALVLAGVEIKNLTYAERLSECEKFAMAVTRTFFPKMSKLVVTRTFDFVQLSKFLEGVVATPEDKDASKSNNTMEVKHPKLRIPVSSVYKLRGRSKNDDLWFVPSGMLFFEAGSNSKDFCSSLMSRIFWEWVETGMDIPFTNAIPSISNAESSPEELRPIGSVSAKKLIDFAHRYS